MASERLKRARTEHTNALLNATTRDESGDLRALAAAQRRLAREENNNQQEDVMSQHEEEFTDMIESPGDRGPWIRLDGWQLKQLHALFQESGIITSEDTLDFQASTENGDVLAVYQCRDGRAIDRVLEAAEED